MKTLNKKKKIIIIVVCSILIIGSVLLSVFFVNENLKIEEINKYVAAYNVGVGTVEYKGYEINFNMFTKLTSEDFVVELEDGLNYENGRLYGEKNIIGETRVCLVKYKKSVVFKIVTQVMEVEKVIYTKEDFLTINDRLDKNYIMGRNIDLKNMTRGVNIFSGYFYGNGYKFTNLNLNVVNGLFGETLNAHIDGIVVENVSGQVTNGNVGAISPKSYSTRFVGCNVSGNIQVEVSQTAYVGAFVGFHEEIERIRDEQISDYFINCISDVNMSVKSSGGELFVGGIVGYTKNGLVTNCTNNGNLTIETNGLDGLFVGGISGGVNKIYDPFNHKINYLDKAEKLTNNGNISIKSAGNKNEIFVGGIFGEVINQNISECSNNGEIICKIDNSKLVGGGIIGFSKATYLDMKINANKQNKDFSVSGSGTIIIGGICGVNQNAVYVNNIAKLPKSDVANAIIGEIIAKEGN